MKRTIYIIIFLLNYVAYGQSFSIFSVDATSFPTIKANFFVVDTDGNQLTNFSISDFSLTENGVSRKITNISCPTSNPPQTVSIAMSIDVSGSMAGGLNADIPVELGKSTARDLCNIIPMPPSEFALQTCDSKALIIQDFTTNKSKILSSLDPINAYGDNDFVEQLLNPQTGLLNIAKNGKYKRIAVIYTDAWWYALTDQELERCKDTCYKYKIQFYAIIYSTMDAEPDGIKKSLKSLADATGGIMFDGITSVSAAKDLANILQLQTQGGDPCQIEWESGKNCSSGIINVDAKLKTLNLEASTSYQTPNSSIAKLIFTPSSIKFKNAIPGIKKDTTIIVTAENTDFHITNITSSNPAYTITPTNFYLNSGQSKTLTVSYVPADSGYTFTKFTFENEICSQNYYASGGFVGKKPKIQTLKLLQPNGQEVFVVGMDTVITWEGVMPEEKVKIEYTTDNGVNWLPIADTATGLSYKWIVPKTPSNQCLARVTSNLGYEYSGCANGDVQICSQIWMGCNLDVETYRNGDLIPEVTDPTEWASLTTGAWCYYNNDPAMGEIYGKLYNSYAVSDPRGLAPEGWHIASSLEWEELEGCLIDPETAGGRLKSTGTIEDGTGLWYSPNTGATNETGFTALPAGYRDVDGGFYFMGMISLWWNSLEDDKYNNWCTGLIYNFSNIINGESYKNEGYSVRCIRD